MKRMMGLLLVVALLGAGVAAPTPMGAGARAWGAGAYQTGYVALAWPVASALGDLDRVPRALGQGRPVPSLVIPWRSWTRYGVDWRWRTLQANRTQGQAIGQGMLYGYGGLGLLLTLLLGVPLARLTQRGRRIKPVGAGGTARWATWRDLRRYWARRGQARVMLGRLGGRAVSLVGELQYLNALVVAPPGMGKTSGLIIPNILAELGDRPAGLWRRARWGRGLVISDLKGELALRTLAARGRTHRCLVVDFYAPQTSAAYNPLAHVHTPAEVAEFIDCWFDNTGGVSSSDQYFDNSTKLVFQAAILHLQETHRRGRLGEPTLTHLDAFLAQGPAAVTAALLASPSDEAYGVGTRFLAVAAANEKIISGVFTDIPNRLRVVQDPAVRAVTGSNEIDFRALADRARRPIALYVSLDPAKDRVLPAVFFSQLFTALRETARAHDGALPRKVYCYLDEAGNCGRITNLTTALTTGRAAGVGFLLIVQTLAQLEALYGREGKATLMAGCGSKMALSGTGDADAEWFSRQTDKQTVTAANVGEQRKIGAWRPQNDSAGYTETSTELITAGQIRTLPRDQMVLLTGNVPPVKLAQRAWYQTRYRDNWPMLLQVRMRVGAPRWWPWSGPSPTSAGPRRATPLVPPWTPRLERPPATDALDLEGSELTMGAPAGHEVGPASGAVATTFGRLTPAPAPAPFRGATALPEAEDEEDTDAPPPGRGSVPPPQPRAGVTTSPAPWPRPERPAGEGRRPGAPASGQARKGNAWDDADADGNGVVS